MGMSMPVNGGPGTRRWDGARLNTTPMPGAYRGTDYWLNRHSAPMGQRTVRQLDRRRACALRRGSPPASWRCAFSATNCQMCARLPSLGQLD
jgi:hypothetical protein